MLSLGAEILPVVCVGMRLLLEGKCGPLLCESGIELDEWALTLFNLLGWHDGGDRALRRTNTAIGAFIGIDYEKVRALTKAVGRADLDAIDVWQRMQASVTT